MPPTAILEVTQNLQEKSKYMNLKFDEAQPEEELYLQPVSTYENVRSDQEDIYEEMAEWF